MEFTITWADRDGKILDKPRVYSEATHGVEYLLKAYAELPHMLIVANEGETITISTSETIEIQVTCQVKRRGNKRSS